MILSNWDIIAITIALATSITLIVTTTVRNAQSQRYIAHLLRRIEGYKNTQKYYDR